LVTSATFYRVRRLARHNNGRPERVPAPWSVVISGDNGIAMAQTAVAPRSDWNDTRKLQRESRSLDAIGLSDSYC